MFAKFVKNYAKFAIKMGMVLLNAQNVRIIEIWMKNNAIVL